MSSVDVSSESVTGIAPVKAGEFKLEVVGCSIRFGTNITSEARGSAQSLYLIVPDIDAARDELLGRGVDVSEVFHEGMPGARFHDSGRVSGPAPERGTYGSFAVFSDPDGNGWLLQEITARLAGR